MVDISGTVGLGGINRSPDVAAVQRLLTRAGVSPGPIDGICGRLTIGAIERYQGRFLREPDARVDPGGPTLRRLNAPRPAPAPAARPAPRSAPAARAPAPRPDLLETWATDARQYGNTAMESLNGAGRAVGTFFTETIPGFFEDDDGPAPILAQRRAPMHEDPYAFWTTRTALPSPDCNRGLVSPTARQLTALLGDPTAARVVGNVVTESVGPFRATGLKPALASMRQVMAEVQRDLPDLIPLLQSRGMRVVRKTRKAATYSLHSWGIAIDISIRDHLPPYGGTYSNRGLDGLAPYFNKAGWYWGGGYRSINRKDPMHFECGLALVRSWAL